MFSQAGRPIYQMRRYHSGPQEWEDGEVIFTRKDVDI